MSMFKIKNFNWLFIAILMQQIAREVGCCVFSPFQFKSHSSYNLWAVPMMNIKFNYMSCIVIINRTSDLSCQYILVPKWAREKKQQLQDRISLTPRSIFNGKIIRDTDNNTAYGMDLYVCIFVCFLCA